MDDQYRAVFIKRIYVMYLIGEVKENGKWYNLTPNNQTIQKIIDSWKK